MPTVTQPAVPGSGSPHWVRREPLAGDASSRRYWRLWREDGATAILAEYPADARPAMDRDLEVLRWFSQTGLRVPAVFRHDLDEGWLILEDLGAEDAEGRLRRTPEGERGSLARAAIDPLSVLAGIDVTSLPAWNPALDSDRMRWELAGFELWYVVHHLTGRPSGKLDQWLDDLATEVAAHPVRICHRDYHLNNLFFLPSGKAAMIDVQDVLLGPDTYDAVSLLEERAMAVLVTAKERQQLRQAWALTTGAAEGWEERWLRVRLQRALKVIGTFARLDACGRSGYGSWMRALATDLITEADQLQLPGELVDLLLD